jgi:hypothetical protein
MYYRAMKTTTVTVRTTDRDRLRALADGLGGVPSHRLVGAMLLAWEDLPAERQYGLLSQTTERDRSPRRSKKTSTSGASA